MPPLPEVGCPTFLEIWNPWGKVIERSGFTFENFSQHSVRNLGMVPLAQGANYFVNSFVTIINYLPSTELA